MGTPFTSSLREKKLRCSSQAVGGLTATRERASPSPPLGRAMEYGQAAQGVPSMEPGWLLGCHPAGRERRCGGKDTWACLDVLIGMIKETTTALCLTGEGVNLRPCWPALPDYRGSPQAHFAVLENRPSCLTYNSQSFL